MAKKIIYENDAKQKILAGIEKLEKATSVTLGPAGKNVIIDEYGSIHVTKDGVTTAKAITLKDPFENIGANAIKEVAQKSNDKVGDGTTTSTLLAARIFKNGLKYVALGSNATQVKSGISKAAKFAADYVKSIAKPISTKDDIKKVCTVSANGDEKIGEIISSIMDKLGKDGVIKVDNGNTAEMTSKIVEGITIENGYASPYMVTSQETMDADLDHPLVLVANQKLSNFQDLLPTLQSVSQTGKPFVIIADDFAEDVMATLVMNKLRGFNVVAIKSPSYGDNRKAVLQDIAIAIGGQVVSEETGIKIQDATTDSGIIGSANRVLVTKDQSVIFNGNGDEDEVKARIEAIKNQLENCKSEYDAEKLRDRLGKLSNGIGIINVGADTEAERKELRDRVDDAFCAAKSAIKSGIVSGGGTALLAAKKALESADLKLVGDEKIGAQIFCSALDAPIRKILDNAGLDTEKIVLNVNSSDKKNYGYNVLKQEYVDMLEDGVVDSADVVVNEIQNSASIGGLLLTTECIIVDEPEEKASSCNCNQGVNGMM